MKEDVAAKSLLLGKEFKSTMKYADDGIVLAEPCPVCGEWHEDTLAVYGSPDRAYIVTCPNTGIEIYGIYA